MLYQNDVHLNAKIKEKLFAEQLATQLPVAGMKKVNSVLKAQIIYP